MNMHVKAKTELKLEGGKSYRGQSGAIHRIEANDNSAWPFKTANEDLGVSRFWKVNGEGYNTDGRYTHATTGDDLVAEVAKFAVGDKVRMLVGGFDLTAGKTYPVMKVFDKDVLVIDNVGDSNRVCMEDIELLPATYTSCAAAEVDNLADEYGGGAKAKFKVGDRVRTKVGVFTFDPTDGVVGCEYDGMHYKVDVGDGEGAIWYYLPEELEHVAVAPATATLRIEAGKFYQTRDGRKVGPITNNGYDVFGAPEFPSHWYENGLSWIDGRTTSTDLIAEWQDEPVVAPAVVSASPKFKVGDRVKFRDDYGSSARGKEAVVVRVDDWGIQVDGAHGVSTEHPSDLVLLRTTTIADIVRKHSAAIVCVHENGQPLPATRPFVHADRASATTEASRLAGINKGKEFGVYELVDVAKVGRVYDHEWQRLAARGSKIPAIKALRDLAGIDLAAAKSGVEQFLLRAA